MSAATTVKNPSHWYRNDTMFLRLYAIGAMVVLFVCGEALFAAAGHGIQLAGPAMPPPRWVDPDEVKALAAMMAAATPLIATTLAGIVKVIEAWKKHESRTRKPRA